MKVAVVVAHYDDEVIWCGAMVQRLRLGNEVDIFVVAEDKDYKPCPITIPSLDDYNLILTHGARGEYGHPDHLKVHREVVRRCEGRVVTFGGTWDGDRIDYLVRVLASDYADKSSYLTDVSTKKEVSEICRIQSWVCFESGSLSHCKTGLANWFIDEVGGVRVEI